MTKKHLSRQKFLALAAASTGAVAAAGTGLLAAPKSAPAQKETSHSGMPQWGMVIDLRRCIGCKACAVACKTEFDIRLGVFRSNVIEYDAGTFPASRRSFLPWLCNHCEKPLCTRDCPVDPVESEYNGIKYKKRATYKRPDGAVLIDQDRCVGCGACVELCPYNVRYLDPAKPAGGNPDSNAADKCTFCMHRVEAGVVPSCVNTCQARARIFGDLNDPKSEISKLVKKNKTERLLSNAGTKPNIYYIGLDEYAYSKGYDIRDEVMHENQREFWQGGEGDKTGHYKGGK